MEGAVKGTTPSRPRKVTQMCAVEDQRRQMALVYVVCDDGSMWVAAGEDDWAECFSVPGTARRLEQEGG